MKAATMGLLASALGEPFRYVKRAAKRVRRIVRGPDYYAEREPTKHRRARPVCPACTARLGRPVSCFKPGVFAAPKLSPIGRRNVADLKRRLPLMPFIVVRGKRGAVRIGLPKIGIRRAPVSA